MVNNNLIIVLVQLPISGYFYQIKHIIDRLLSHLRLLMCLFNSKVKTTTSWFINFGFEIIAVKEKFAGDLPDLKDEENFTLQTEDGSEIDDSATLTHLPQIEKVYLVIKSNANTSHR